VFVAVPAPHLRQSVTHEPRPEQSSPASAGSSRPKKESPPLVSAAGPLVATRPPLVSEGSGALHCAASSSWQRLKSVGSRACVKKGDKPLDTGGLTLDASFGLLATASASALAGLTRNVNDSRTNHTHEHIARASNGATTPTNRSVVAAPKRACVKQGKRD